MSRTDINLPAEEVCSIIEACGKAGVRVFKYGDLCIHLGPAPVRVEHELVKNDFDLPDHDQQNKDALERDEFELRSEQMSLLNIESPAEYEKQLRDDELLDDESDGTEE